VTDDPHKSYLDERRVIESSEADAAKSFDQAMLTLSGGALGLSVTFIEHIAPRPLPWTLWILFPGMLFLGLSLALTLASFLISQYACRQSRHDLDRLYDAEFAQRFETESIDDWWCGCNDAFHHGLPARDSAGAKRLIGSIYSRQAFLLQVCFSSFFSVCPISVRRRLQWQMTGTRLSRIPATREAIEDQPRQHLRRRTTHPPRRRSPTRNDSSCPCRAPYIARAIVDVIRGDTQTLIKEHNRKHPHRADC